MQRSPRLEKIHNLYRIKKNDGNSVVTSLIKKEKVQKAASEHIVESSFGGSLPSFLASFFGGKKISDKEAEELKRLIDNYTEEK